MGRTISLAKGLAIQRGAIAALTAGAVLLSAFVAEGAAERPRHADLAQRAGGQRRMQADDAGLKFQLNRGLDKALWAHCPERSDVFDVSETGAFVGSCDGMPFIYRNHGFELLPTLGGTQGVARSTNGTFAVGQATLAGNTLWNAVRWNLTTRPVTAQPLAPFSGFPASDALGVDRAGDVTVLSYDESGNTQGGVWLAKPNMLVPVGGSESIVSGMNGTGTFVGGMYAADSSFVPFEANVNTLAPVEIGGGVSGFASGINGKGTAIGTIVQPGGTLTIARFPDPLNVVTYQLPSGFQGREGLAINDRGDGVGTMLPVGATIDATHGVLLVTTTTRGTDLNEVTQQAAFFPGQFLITGATSITDNNVLVLKLDAGDFGPTRASVMASRPKRTLGALAEPTSFTLARRKLSVISKDRGLPTALRSLAARAKADVDDLNIRTACALLRHADRRSGRKLRSTISSVQTSLFCSHA